MLHHFGIFRAEKGLCVGLLSPALGKTRFNERRGLFNTRVSGARLLQRPVCGLRGKPGRRRGGALPGGPFLARAPLRHPPAAPSRPRDFGTPARRATHAAPQTPRPEGGGGCFCPAPGSPAPSA